MLHPLERRPLQALVIDSHAPVCDVLSRMLERFGIRTTVAHGSEAAASLLAGDHQIDLVFAEIGGAHDCCASLLARLRAECPHVKVVCVTPYNADLGDLGAHAHGRLLKPFTPEDVMTVVVYAMAA